MGPPHPGRCGRRDRHPLEAHTAAGVTVTASTGAHDLPGLHAPHARPRVKVSARGLLVSLALGGSLSVVALMVITSAMSTPAIAPPVAWVSPATTVAPWPSATTSASTSALATGAARPRIAAKPRSAGPVPITLATPPTALTVARGAPVAAASGKGPAVPADPAPTLVRTTDPPADTVTIDPPVVPLKWSPEEIAAAEARCAALPPDIHGAPQNVLIPPGGVRSLPLTCSTWHE